MQRGFRLLFASVLVVSAVFLVRADTISSQAAEVQLQLGDLLYSEGKYQDSLEAFRNAARVAPPDLLQRVQGGVVQAALRCAEFEEARRHRLAEPGAAAGDENAPIGEKIVAEHGDFHPAKMSVNWLID